MARPSTLARANTRTRGRVHRRLRRWQAQGLPAGEMAYRLRAELDVQVDETTVRRYLPTLTGGSK